MAEETPEIPSPAPQPPRSERKASRFNRTYLLEELGDVAEEVKAVTNTEERGKTTRFPDLSFDDLEYPIPPESRSSPQEIQDFRIFDDIIFRLLDLTNEPIALFGSHALFRLGKGSTEVPKDSDITTTPAGAIELYKALQERSDIKLEREPYIHDPDGPLKALRFDGKIQISRQGKIEEHPFEVFGEGGEYRGEKLLGLFRLGNLKDQWKSVITQKIVRAGYILESYKRLIDEIEAQHPSKRLIRDKWQRRVDKIRQLKQQFEKTGYFNRKELQKTILDEDSSNESLSA